ncbi:ATP-binding protein [Deinococcus sp. JMULE3]|uniref:ATP-binding protein n=1 Tax=Deinococcus sp. JMULE3 TaxID=2518341 RepID=UPI0015770008|nr:ATP-binding protein [Deinococcus sp. JMULE3]NTY01796.1 ATP-binding protein [Deinococcus sp. JMULE3]
MKLLTLGGLRVDGASYRREKPLLLLAYLLLEGPQPRRRLADLFWPDAANPMNSLAQNLIRLRPLGAITETDQRVEAHLPCDAADFRAHHRAARWTEACDTYTGEFLEGLRLDLTPDLEEWLLDTRDTLASEARAAHLTLAEHHHARAEPTPAHAHAERAYRTPGAPPCPPEDLTRLWHLLGSTDHPLTLHLRRDADDLGLRLPTPTPPTPDHTLIGRHDELSTLTGLPTGSVAWISGPPGIGKTTLLRALTRHGWRLLSARGGLPLATLEPLSPHPLSSTADALNLLRDTRLKLAIDDWEDCDDTTRAALTLAARQTPGATIAITARHPPPSPPHITSPCTPSPNTTSKGTPARTPPPAATPPSSART